MFTGEHAAELKQHIHTVMKEQEKDLKAFERVQVCILSGLSLCVLGGACRQRALAHFIVVRDA